MGKIEDEKWGKLVLDSPPEARKIKPIKANPPTHESLAAQDVGKANPPTPESLAAQDEGGSWQPSDLARRLERYGTAKNRNCEMADHLVREGHRDLADRLYACGSYLRFRYYLSHQQTRLIESRSCDVALLCPLCAIRRSARLLRRYLERCTYLASAHDFYLVTLTVKNGPDLTERYTHLLSSWKRITQRAKKGYGAFATASGAFGSIEVTKSGHGWHPHMHMVWAIPKGMSLLRWGKGSQLSKDWMAATGDSCIVHAERIGAAGGIPLGCAGGADPLVSALCEVLKYSLKFSSLSLSDNLEAYWMLKGKRLTRAYGCFWGLEIPDEPLDDSQLDGPFLEWLFCYARSRGYLISAYVDATVVPERN